MSLTSYRAAPPRVNFCRAFQMTRTEKKWLTLSRATVQPQGFLRRLKPRWLRSAVGCGRYVPMQRRFGKGLAQSFFQFCDGLCARPDGHEMPSEINDVNRDKRRRFNAHPGNAAALDQPRAENGAVWWIRHARRRRHCEARMGRSKSRTAREGWIALLRSQRRGLIDPNFLGEREDLEAMIAGF
jgi:hypothetical protein